MMQGNEIILLGFKVVVPEGTSASALTEKVFELQRQARFVGEALARSAEAERKVHNAQKALKLVRAQVRAAELDLVSEDSDTLTDGARS